jgi:dihydroneopterin aldolase
MLVLEQYGIAWVRVALSKPGAIRNSRDVGIIVERERRDLDAWAARAVP